MGHLKEGRARVKGKDVMRKMKRKLLLTALLKVPPLRLIQSEKKKEGLRLLVENAANLSVVKRHLPGRKLN
ncbi:hypothetical protein NQ314_004326 [Rhamnusium bicolor]|uniref:Uncharacterized protein n=1 Tax=Rhamnusium bicolor TaxID=1586634 RepID=A0AAV8ZJT7_9CUCU|nr:hypothetical protein NQ314_004326 [Rhamnusium bicolor]